MNPIDHSGRCTSSPMSGPVPGLAIHTGWLNPNPHPQGPPFLPAQDTQELYHKMRDAEAAAADKKDEPRLNAANLAQVSGRESELKPPSPISGYGGGAGGTPLSRQSSQRSHASSTTKRKARRNGPLDEYARQKAAFFRKIGVCEDCRSRRVSCNPAHRNLTLFENNYQASRSQRQYPRTPPSLAIPSSAVPCPIPDPTFLGLGDGRSDEMTVDYPTNLNFEDMEDILPHSPAADQPSMGMPDPGRSMALVGSKDPEEPYLPIGRYSDTNLTWECQYGNLDNASHSAASSVASFVDRCHSRVYQLDDLRAHFVQTHGPFREHNPPFMYQCVDCHTMNLDDNHCVTCCRRTRSIKFFFGYVSQTNAPFGSQGIAIMDPSHTSPHGPDFLSPSPGTSNTTGSLGNTFGPWGGGGHMNSGGQTGWGHKEDIEAPGPSCHGAPGFSCSWSALKALMNQDAVCGTLRRNWMRLATIVFFMVLLAHLNAPCVSQVVSTSLDPARSAATLASWIETSFLFLAIFCVAVGVATTWGLSRYTRQRFEGRAVPRTAWLLEYDAHEE
ncbi:hypothetical protein MKZ38_004309 [Zalerion maritima]|uniref:Uncharacterized protein n=1 Tax=Zalerion maritima TaxID=339359 RepID=A0AAD5WR51_9PEZI|nr:hypothetical protein MKZ38_004309 [Zalerion maritima]